MDESRLNLLPKALQTAFQSPIVERRPWSTGLATYAIGLFLWVGLFDQLGARTLAIGGLAPSILGVLIAGLLCFSLLFLAPALWGQQVGRPMIVVAASTFGTSGVPWIPCLLMAVGQVVWFGVALGLALHLILQGLVGVNLLDAAAIEPRLYRGFPIDNPLVLTVGLLWSYAVAVIGSLAVKLVVALNRVFPVIPALLLSIITLLLVRTAVNTPSGIDPISALPVAHGSWRTILAMVTLVGGFFALTGVGSIDWGRASSSASDVYRGGIVGIIFTPCVVITLALLCVAGAIGQNPPVAAIAPSIDAEITLANQLADPGVRSEPIAEQAVLKATHGAAYRFEPAIEAALGSRLGAVALMIFGLAGLTPACYAASSAVSITAGFRKRPRRIRIGTYLSLVAYPLIAFRAWSHLELVFSVMGVVFAPVVAAITADYVRHRGVWPGMTEGWNRAGLVAWALGFLVGFIPTVMGVFEGSPPWPWWLAGYATTFVSHLALATLLRPMTNVLPPVVE